MPHEYHYCPNCDTSFYAPLSDAAPDLLAALEALLATEDEANSACLWCGDIKWLRHPNGGRCAVDNCPGVMARAAIAKATSPQAQ